MAEIVAFSTHAAFNHAGMSFNGGGDFWLPRAESDDTWAKRTASSDTWSKRTQASDNWTKRDS